MEQRRPLVVRQQLAEERHAERWLEQLQWRMGESAGAVVLGRRVERQLDGMGGNPRRIFLDEPLCMWLSILGCVGVDLWFGGRE